MISEVKSRNKLNSQLKPPTARIQRVSNTGLVTIEFSEKLLIPQNFINISRSLLRVKISDSEGSDIKFTWNITEYEGNELKIQIIFENALGISRSVSLNMIEGPNRLITYLNYQQTQCKENYI